MLKKWFFILLVVFGGIVLNACSEYNKVLKSSDLELKFQKANEYYEKGDYYKAYPLIEELSAIYRGQRRSEKLFYMFAYCDYYQEDYLLSSHRFSEFTKTFPTSKYTEECSFMSAYSLYRLTPPAKLDQSNTFSAIAELQLFVDRYPRSTRVDTCNVLIKELEAQIEKKTIMGADQYKKMEDFSAAVITYENILKDFPDTKYREEIYYKIFDSYYLLAVKSVTSKKLVRIDAALKAYVNFANRYPNSEFSETASTQKDRLEELRLKLQIEK